MGLNHGWRGPNIVRDGLVLYLDAGSPNSYQGSGTTWKDISKYYQNDGTLTNGPTYSSDGGGSIVFDGVDDYCDIGGTSTFSSNTLTFSVWFKRPSTATSFGYVFAKQFDGSFGSFWLYTNGGNNYSIGIGTTNNVFATSTSFSPISDTWYNVVGVYNGTNMLLYLNSSLYSTTPYPGTTIRYNNSSINLGRYGNLAPSSIYSACSVASYQLYNRALSASEVQQNFNALRGRYGI